MAATPAASRRFSAPASGLRSPATLTITEASFSAGKRELNEDLPLTATRPAVTQRIEVDFTDFIYLGTVVRHGSGLRFDATFDSDGETVTITPGKHRFRCLQAQVAASATEKKAAPKKKAAGAKKTKPTPKAPKRKRAATSPTASASASASPASSPSWIGPAAPIGGASVNASTAIVEWAQCDDPACGRWHELPPHIRPTDLPSPSRGRRGFVCALNNWDVSKSSCVKGGAARRESLAASSPQRTADYFYRVGDLVNVDRRLAKDGGTGKITAITDGLLYTIKYTMGGQEKNIKRVALELLESAEATAAQTTSENQDADEDEAQPMQEVEAQGVEQPQEPTEAAQPGSTQDSMEVDGAEVSAPAPVAAETSLSASNAPRRVSFSAAVQQQTVAAMTVDKDSADPAGAAVDPSEPSVKPIEPSVPPPSLAEFMAMSDDDEDHDDDSDTVSDEVAAAGLAAVAASRAAGGAAQAAAAAPLVLKSSTSLVLSKKKQLPQKKAPPGTSSGNIQAKHTNAAKQESLVPLPGHVCTNARWYSTLDNETTGQVADKLGCDWKQLANLKANKDRYGKLAHNSKMRTATLLRIPTVFSKWRVRKLYEQEEEEEVCTVCMQHEHAHDSPIMLCDGCDAAMHLDCSGLSSVPVGDYFCVQCLGVLRERKLKYGAEGGSLKAELPLLPVLVAAPQHGAALQSLLANRNAVATAALLDSHKAVLAASLSRETELCDAQIPAAQLAHSQAQAAKDGAFAVACDEYQIQGWGGQEGVYRVGGGGYWQSSYYSRPLDPRYSSRWIRITDTVMNYDAIIPFAQTRTTTLYEKHEVRIEYEVDPARHYYGGGQQGQPTRVKSARWQAAKQRRQQLQADGPYAHAVRALKQAKTKCNALVAEKQTLLVERRERPYEEQDELRRLNAEYACLLNEPRTHTVSIAEHAKREVAPKLLGELTLVDDGDVTKMHLLCEPAELLIFVPLDKTTRARPLGLAAQQVDDVSGLAILRAGGSFAVYARQGFFCREREDETPVSAFIRDGVRRLMALLIADQANTQAVVSHPHLPPSVRLRGGVGDEGASDCFDLSALVRDCNVPLDLPKEPTPPRMAQNGLELREYQEASLRWMLDKEREPSGLGSMGELWHRLRFLDGQGENYFYCELTGSVSMDIFDFRDDVGQKDAATAFGGLPTGGILGEEMGLGKTMICLALTVVNPPPPSHSVLPRENLWAMEKHVVEHSEYSPPPSLVGASRAAAKMVLSNGTLVVAPMTLIAQWQNVSTITLHASASVLLS